VYGHAAATLQGKIHLLGGEYTSDWEKPSRRNAKVLATCCLGWSRLLKEAYIEYHFGTTSALAPFRKIGSSLVAVTCQNSLNCDKLEVWPFNVFNDLLEIWGGWFGLANRRLKPLGHLSIVLLSPDYHRRRRLNNTFAKNYAGYSAAANHRKQEK
jgi:hypothetical protein